MNEEFNSIYLSTFALGKELPEGMKRDFFNCEIFEINSKFHKEEEIGYMDGTPDQKDERFPTAGIAYIDAINLVNCVFLVDVINFERGKSLASSNSLSSGKIEFDMYIYSMEEDKLINLSNHQIQGPSVVSYMYDPNKSFSEQQKEADFYLDEENEEFYPKAILNIFCKNHNFY